VRLASVQPPDIVLVSKGGRRFHAHVRGIRDGVVEFSPSSAGSATGTLPRARCSRSGIAAVPDATLDEGDPQPAVSKAQLSLAGRFGRPAAAQG
jgi:hypothetical protein